MNGVTQQSEVHSLGSERPTTAPQNQYTFAYDRVFGEECSQSEIYSSAVQPVVLSSLEGYNGCIIAYGQTGTGKTYTIEGASDGPHRGIIPLTADDVRADCTLFCVHVFMKHAGVSAHSSVIRNWIAVPGPGVLLADLQ